MIGFQFFRTMTFEGEMGAFNGTKHFWLSILYQVVVVVVIVVVFFIFFLSPFQFFFF